MCTLISLLKQHFLLLIKAADSIIWELFAGKSAEFLNLCNSFITISNTNTRKQKASKNVDFALFLLLRSFQKFAKILFHFKPNFDKCELINSED